MATTYHPALGVEAKSQSSFLGQVFNRIVEARQQEANRRVQQYLRTYAPDTLRNIGYTEAEIQEIYNKSAV